MTTGIARSARPIRVLVWTHALPAGLAAELKRCGIELVGLLHGTEAGLPSWSFRDLLEPSPARLDACEPWLSPIPESVLQDYLDGMARLSPVPCSREVETLRISAISSDQAHDLVYVHAASLNDILERLRPDMIWFFSMPHLGIDALLRYLAEQSGLRCIGFRQTRIQGRYMAYDLDRTPWARIEADGSAPHDTGAILPAVAPTAPGRKRMTEMMSTLKFYLGGFLSSSRDRVFHRLHQATYWRQWYRLLFLLDLFDGRTRAIAWVRYRRERDYRRSMRRLKSRSSGDLPENFVYFPLHLEPEANTTIFAGRFQNQILALENIAARLPPDWKLLIRENPKQTGAWRSPVFFQRLERTGNIELSTRSPATLLQNCRLVGTICGSAGYEALRMGKPVVYFGDAWYAGLHGAHEFNEAIDLEEVAKQAVCRAELDRSANTLISGFHHGVVFSRDFALYSDYQPADFAAITARSLRRVVDHVLTSTSSAVNGEG